MEKAEELLNKIDNDLKKVLSEKRYNHSIGVMKKAEELAKIYKIDVDKAKLVGLAHDIGKELSKEEMLEYARKNNIEVDSVEEVNVGLLHAKIGADICKRKYGFSQDMQNAIKYHTVGNENMDLLAKIIYVADKIEDGRTYNSEEKMKELQVVRDLATKDINKALVYEIDSSITYTIQKHKLIHPDSILTRNMLLKVFISI
jgi:predicted HD superfamily hydrolase involved in NAD metabolism